MSPFSQLSSHLTYGNAIDRNFSPILNYIDEFDRHFSHRHRFVNCFIPRFDLEEDGTAYYLFGDIPGARLEDVTVEAHDNHTLVVYGSTQRLNQEHQNSPKSEGADYVKVALTDGQGVAEEKAPTPAPAVADPNEYVNEERRNSTTPAFPPPPPNQTHPHHLRHTPGLIQGDNDAIRSAPNSNQIDQYPASDPYMGPEVHNGTVIGNRVLLNERLAGDFHRTFAFPCPISDDAVKAMMENGVLKVVVPKREVGEVRRGRKVPIIRGNFWTGGEKVGKGTAFGVSSGAV